MGVTKRLLKHTQFILSQYDKAAKDKFEKLIARFLSEEEILIWKLKKDSLFCMMKMMGQLNFFFQFLHYKKIVLSLSSHFLFKVSVIEP